MSGELDALRAEHRAQDQEIARLRKVLEERDAAMSSQAQSLASANARLDEVSKRADQLNAKLERVGAQNTDLIRTLADTAKAERDTKKPGK